MPFRDYGFDEKGKEMRWFDPIRVHFKNGHKDWFMLAQMRYGVPRRPEELLEHYDYTIMNWEEVNGE